MTLATRTPTAATEIDEIEASFLSNIERNEAALAAAETDYERLKIRDAARTAQAATTILGHKQLVRRFSVLIQRAERAIAKANPPMSPKQASATANAAKNGHRVQPEGHGVSG